MWTAAVSASDAYLCLGLIFAVGIQPMDTADDRKRGQVTQLISI
jgi:hypothetical protein